jgi:hypothetical protein
MSIKQFLKPDWRKILIFIMLFIISTLTRANLFSNYEVKYPFYPFVLGTPFVFCYVYPIVELTPEIRFNFLGLFGDIIFWYFISCFVFWIYDKFKKKPQ